MTGKVPATLVTHMIMLMMVSHLIIKEISLYEESVRLLEFLNLLRQEILPINTVLLKMSLCHV